MAGFSGYGSASLLTADPAKANKNYKITFLGSGTEDAGYGHDCQIWRQYLYRLLQQTFRD